MRFKLPYQSSTLGSLIVNLSLAVGLLAFLSLFYFYIYLPNTTNHGETITVPSLEGMAIDKIDDFLSGHDLRYEINDSSYSEDFPPLTVLQQFPKPGSKVKENRKIYITLNRVTPPTVPMPDLVDRSRINAEVVLKSNELRRGHIILEPSPFLNLVKEMRYMGKPIKEGTRVPKGAVIDLVVGDGYGRSDFRIGNLIGDSYETALFKLQGWNLHLGSVEIPAGVDTTGTSPVVYKQYPEVNEQVRVGDPVDLWLAPPGYVEPDIEEDEDPEFDEL
ncbi:MAG TPA: PASTA domain-containing protein [Cyclobacteriaceae bacterium]|jgi:beta-lactam-binding protein with PASTA domain|nr:PASTA domain-containing protein [Cyclobacteriaceae bacterium]HRK55179.1 PASTA domain-containing protein [Cyclobacteriaceae bacterium]